MKLRPADDKLDDPLIWRDLIKDYASSPMNYGTDIRAVGPLARAAGIEPSRAIARVLTYWHRHDTMN